jgi:uncharacterized protein
VIGQVSTASPTAHSASAEAATAPDRRDLRHDEHRKSIVAYNPPCDWKGSMRYRDLNIPQDRLADFCEKHGVKRLSLFGSALRDDFGPESDVDLLVEFLPGRTPGMFGFGQMIIELREIIGREVDLRTPNDLSPYFRDHVLREARPLHAA